MEENIRLVNNILLSINEPFLSVAEGELVEQLIFNVYKDTWDATLSILIRRDVSQSVYRLFYKTATENGVVYSDFVLKSLDVFIIGGC